MDTVTTQDSEYVQKIRELEEEIVNLKEHLKKYTAPERKKKYYETHKEEIKQKVKDTTDPEKKKEYNKKYYLKKKGITI